MTTDAQFMIVCVCVCMNALSVHKCGMFHKHYPLTGSSDDSVNRHSYPSSNELGDPQKVVAESYDSKGTQLKFIT